MEEFIKEVEELTGVYDLMSLDKAAFEKKIDIWIYKYGGKVKKSIRDFNLPQKKLHPIQTIAGFPEYGRKCGIEGCLCNLEDIPIAHKMEFSDGWGYPSSPSKWTYYSVDLEGRLINPHFYNEESLELDDWTGSLLPPKSEMSEKILQLLDLDLMKKKSIICDQLYDITLPAMDQKKRCYGFAYNPNRLILFNNNLIPIKIFKFMGTYQSWYINSLGNLCFITDNGAFWKGNGENYVRVYTVTDEDLDVT